MPAPGCHADARHRRVHRLPAAPGKLKPTRKEITLKKAFILWLALLLAACPALAHTREEVRRAYGAIRAWDGPSPYAAPPTVAAPYEAG